MHPFSVMQFGTGFEPPNKYRAFQSTTSISVRKSVHIENSYLLLPLSLLPPKITFPASRLPLSVAV